jgi:hypothetical protein
MAREHLACRCAMHVHHASKRDQAEVGIPARTAQV